MKTVNELTEAVSKITIANAQEMARIGDDLNVKEYVDLTLKHREAQCLSITLGEDVIECRGIVKTGMVRTHVSFSWKLNGKRSTLSDIEKLQEQATRLTQTRRELGRLVGFNS